MINRVFAVAVVIGAMSTSTAAVGASIDFSITGNPLSDRWVREQDERDALEGSALDLSKDRGEKRVVDDVEIGPDSVLGPDMRAETAPAVATD